jgi:hypothetical protein
MSAMTCLWPVVQSALLALELTSSLVVPSDEEGGGEAAFATRGRAKVAKMKRKLHDYLFGWSFNWLRWAKNEIYEGEGSTVVRRIHFHLSRSKILQEQTSLEVSQKPFSLLSQILYIFWGPEMHDTTEKQRRVHEAKGPRSKSPHFFSCHNIILADVSERLWSIKPATTTFQSRSEISQQSKESRVAR